MPGRIKRFLKKNYNLSAWMGTRYIKIGAATITRVIKQLLAPSVPQRSESFEEAMARLNLNEHDIEQKAKDFKLSLIAFIIIATILYLYLIHLIWIRAILASAGVFSLWLVILAQVFRYHFWLFQIRKRKLGCTFDEWLHEVVLGKPYEM
jgi:intracellular multiplication protein IcmV